MNDNLPAETPQPDPSHSPQQDNNQVSELKRGPLGKLGAFFRTKKGKWTIVGIIAFLILLAAGIVAYNRYFKKEAGGIPTKITPQVEAKKVQNPLDGTLVPEAVANRHPLAIMVENSPEARPHVGLDKASLVYEAITEGGITRFMAIYGPNDAEKVGPVRSARTYFVSWAEEYDAFYAHAGGSQDGLAKIETDGVKDLPHTQGYFWREPRSGVASEHTLFTSTEKLYEFAKQKGYDLRGNFQPLDFRTAVQIQTFHPTHYSPSGQPLKEIAGQTTPPQPSSASSTATSISIDFSSPQFKVEYTYDSATKTYLRKLGGEAHKDGVSGKQLAPTNVIVQEVFREPAPNYPGKSNYRMKTVGEGKATIFTNGEKIEGTWKKTSDKERTFFYDKNGNKIKFMPGQFWYEIVPPEPQVKVNSS